MLKGASKKQWPRLIVSGQGDIVEGVEAVIKAWYQQGPHVLMDIETDDRTKYKVRANPPPVNPWMNNVGARNVFYLTAPERGQTVRDVLGMINPPEAKYVKSSSMEFEYVRPDVGATLVIEPRTKPREASD